MKPILFQKGTTSFNNEGIGRLSSAITAKTRDGINNIMELEMVYPMDGEHFSEIEEGSLILASHDESGEEEPYQVYGISRPMNGKVTINAWHWSYMLNGIILRPIRANSLALAISNISGNCINSCPFVFRTTMTNGKPFALTNPVTVRQALGGIEGSFIDTYGGEWEFKGNVCTLKNRLGQDTDVVIKYGKNLTDVNRKTSIYNWWTGIVPYYTSDAVSVYYNGIIYSQAAQTATGFDIVIPVDCSGDFESVPTQQQMQTWGQNYVTNNARNAIPSTIDISFAALWQTEEYKDIAALERLSLGDTVTVMHEALGINHTARIVATEWDVLAERYTKMTIGSVRANIAQKIQNTVSKAVETLPTKDWFEQELDEATEKIKGGLGGYVVMTTNTDGQPQEIVIMDTPSTATAVHCIRLNQNGIGFSSNGYNGTYSSAWLIDGTFDASEINVINLNASTMTAGTIKDRNNVSWWNLESGAMSLGNGNFTVSAAGKVTARGLDLTGSGSISLSYEEIQGGIFSGTIDLNGVYDGTAAKMHIDPFGLFLSRNVSIDEHTSTICYPLLIDDRNSRGVSIRGGRFGAGLTEAWDITIPNSDLLANLKFYHNLTAKRTAMSLSADSLEFFSSSGNKLLSLSPTMLQFKGDNGLTLTEVLANGAGGIILRYNGVIRAQLAISGLTFMDSSGNVTKQYSAI